MADKTGTAGDEFLGQPSEFWWEFTNPAGWAGGAALGPHGNVFNGIGGRGSYVGNKPALRTVPFESYNPKSYAKRVANHNRLRYGVLGIDDPNVNYRQGLGLIRDSLGNEKDAAKEYLYDMRSRSLRP